MKDDELLLAISDIVEAKVAPLHKEIQQVRKEVTEKITLLENHITEVEAKLESRIIEVEAKFESRITEVEAKLESRITEVEAKLEHRITEVEAKLESEIVRISVLMENNVVPRIDNIESCYVSTYNRYVEGLNQISSIQSDVDVIKKVVIEHSKKLQRIS